MSPMETPRTMPQEGSLPRAHRMETMELTRLRAQVASVAPCTHHWTGPPKSGLVAQWALKMGLHLYAKEAKLAY